MDNRLYLVFSEATRKSLRLLTCDLPDVPGNLNDGELAVEVPDGTSDVGWVLDEHDQMAADPVPPPPTFDPVQIQRGERNSLLNASAWTQMADAPLTAACKEAWRLYRVTLNRHLFDYPDGLTALPVEPALDYLPLEDQT